MKSAIILLSFLFVHLFTAAQPFASWKGNQLILDNGVVRREIVLEGNKIITRSLKLTGDDLNFDTGESGEFSFPWMIKIMTDHQTSNWFPWIPEKMISTVMGLLSNWME